MENEKPIETPELDKKDAKLKKALIKYGVSEEEAIDFLQYLKGMPDEEDVEPKAEPSQEPVEEEGKADGEPTEVEEPAVEEPTEPTEPSGEVPPVEEEPAPSEPTEEPVAEPVEEPAPEVPAVEEPSDEELLPEEPQPQADPIDYQAKFEEAQKTIDALTARFDSLEEALKKSGALVPEQNPVGVPSGMPEGSNLESTNDDVLKLLNK